MEIVVLSIACLAVLVNFFINSTNQSSYTDESVLFSFIKNSQSSNPLLTYNDTSTIVSQRDQLVSTAQASSLDLALSKNQSTKIINTASTMQDDVIVKTNPSDTQASSRHGLTTYSVQNGDTLVTVAASFGISPETIMMENKLDTNAKLKPGTELKILPTTGITYTLKDGDSLEALIKKYKLSEDDFLDSNNIESFEDLDVGATVIIPLDNVSVPKVASTFVKSDSGRVALKQASTPSSFIGSPINFVWPTTIHQITQGFSSRHTGIDISDSKMEPIFAAGDGFVEISGYQTNGYGNTIIVNHGNGYKTRYAHASELYVQAGDYVKAGQKIAKQGRTGRVRGATGIHLHFEVMINGKKVNPLSYVKP